MSKKITYLFLALLLPCLVFIFLKFFGKNQFDIPIYYETGIAEVAGDCPETDGGQYFLNDTLLKTINWKNHVALLITGTSQIERKDLARASENVNVQIIDLDSVKANKMNDWKRCAFFLKDPWKVVLIDEQRRIRGYYALNSREEIDRLEVELKILLKKY